MIALPDSTQDLPIHEKLDELLAALENANRAVLIAPPGAGKTTIIPIALLNASWRNERKILVLEPRRLAARNAALRMADLLGEKVGETVGYRIRHDTKVSAKTRIEVVTEGVFTRMLSSDPGLEDVACVVFDEFHERSLDSDLALALCLDLQTGLRDDLRLLPMSATLDGGQVAQTIDAVIVESSGRQYPVEIIYREGKPRDPIESQMVAAIRAEMADPKTGSILCFLPGQREIERVFDGLDGALPHNVALHRLYGALVPAEQDAAINVDPQGRLKVVLSSAIAETSLTIDGITTIVDSGLSRQPVHEPSTGLIRLQTVRADRASITQRAGRAGRLGPGKAVRLWREQQTAALPKMAVPEILNADLTQLVLDLADWGVADPTDLTWLDQPPKPAWNEASNLLSRLGAVKDGALTDHGRALARLPLPPRLAHMVLKSDNAYQAVELALLLQEKGVGGKSADLEVRLQGLSRAKDKRSTQLKKLARRIADQVKNPAQDAQSVGAILAQAFPDRVAARGGQAQNGMVRFTLANGRGAEISAEDALAGNDFLVVADMIGRAGSARIVSAAPIGKADLMDVLSEQIELVRETRFDAAKGALLGEETRNLGALKLEKPRRFTPDAEDVAQALLAAIRRSGLQSLPWQNSDNAVLSKLRFLQERDVAIQKDFSETALLDNLEMWLGPFVSGRVALADFGDGTLTQALLLHSGLASNRDLDQRLPAHFTAPTGSKIPIEYHVDKAVIAVRPQELFGLDAHPSVVNGTMPLEIELLSPAGRPIQITRDLPGFWRGSWADVRADLRGRYPKHPWPENPLEEPPTRRVKPRK